MGNRNIHSINQDDVLGGDDENLSPSEFGRKGGDEHEIDDDPLTQPKKKSGMIPLIGGIVAAVAIVGGFGWKILSPYFGDDRGGNDREAFAQIAAPKPQPFALESAAPQAATPAPAPAAPDQGASAQGLASAVPSPQPQVVVTGPSVSMNAPMPDAAPKVATADDKAIAHQPKVADNPIVLQQQPVQATAAGAEEIAQINKRIDGISTALAALKETVEKLQADMKSHAQAKPAPVAAAAKPASLPVTAKKPAAPSAPAAKKPAEYSKADMAAVDTKPTADLQLQAVLQDRAWFKTKTGETITVSAGEEVKGVGLVKQIDADGGRVIFTNGAVYR